MVHSETRKLKAVWSRESQQDLRSWHNLDAEKIITKIFLDEIQAEVTAEIDAEILNNLRLCISQSQEMSTKKYSKYRSIDDEWEV